MTGAADGPAGAGTGAGPGAGGPRAAESRLRRDYRPAFLRYLSRRDEVSRTAGYELGRRAVVDGEGLLDLVAAHHVTLLEVLGDARDAEETASMSSAAAEFLAEVLASYSMASAAVPDLQHQLAQARDEIDRLRRGRGGAAPGGTEPGRPT